MSNVDELTTVFAMTAKTGAVSAFGSGFINALLLLLVPTIGALMLAILSTLWLRLGASNLPALFLGTGVGIFVWLGQAQLRCAADPHCFAPDASGGIVAAATLVLIGLLGLLVPRVRRLRFRF